MPPWRIQPPAPAEDLLAFYREAEAASGVGWNYLAAINLIETRFGSIVGDSTAGAQGPMQFLPSTFAGYGEGGDIHSPRDSILAAGATWPPTASPATPTTPSTGTNHADQYVRAVNDFAAGAGRRPGRIRRLLQLGRLLRDDRGRRVAPDRLRRIHGDPRR